MPRRNVRLPSANGVGAGQTATFDLPTNRRYYGVDLVYKTNANQATIEADVTKIRVNINGKTQREFTAAELFKMNATNGIAFAAGIIPIMFAEPKRRTVQGEEGLAWGMKDVRTFQIEVDIAGAATAPTLGGSAEIDNVQVPLGLIVKHKRFTFSPTGAGTFQINSLPKNDAFLRTHYFSNIVTNAKVTVDQLEAFNMSLAEATAKYARHGVAMQANTFTVAHDYTQQVTDALPMVKLDGTRVSELMHELTVSGSGSLPVVVEYLGFAD